MNFIRALGTFLIQNAKALGFCALLLAILTYYFLVAFQGRLVPPPPVENLWGRTPDGHLAPAPANNFYAMLSESLLAGKLHFLDEPRRQLLELKDVYNPSENYPWRRYHDASFYKNHWYIYFGVTPALILGIPARLLGFQLRDDVAVALFCWLGLLACLSLLRSIVLLGDLKPRPWMWVAATLCLALCGAQPYMMARSQVYEVAISCGFFCTFTALYFLATGFLFNRIVIWRLAAGSLFLALAVGSRPNTILHGWILAALTLGLYLNRAHLPQKAGAGGISSAKELDAKARTNLLLSCCAALWVPYMIYGYGLGLYNYLRFDSWTDFGFRYALTSFDMRKLHMFNPSYFLPNLWFYVFQPLKLQAAFPFFHTQWTYPGKLPTPYFPEAVAGIRSVAPVLFMLVVLQICARLLPKGALSTSRRIVLLLVAALTIFGLSQLLFLLLAFPYATLRYLVDVLPALILATLLLWFYFHAELSTPQHTIWRRLLATAMVALILAGCVQNIAIGMAGEGDYFERFNPSGYEAVRRQFDFIERLAGASRN